MKGSDSHPNLLGQVARWPSGQVVRCLADRGRCCFCHLGMVLLSRGTGLPDSLRPRKAVIPKSPNIPGAEQLWGKDSPHRVFLLSFTGSLCLLSMCWTRPPAEPRSTCWTHCSLKHSLRASRGGQPRVPCPCCSLSMRWLLGVGSLCWAPWCSL